MTYSIMIVTQNDSYFFTLRDISIIYEFIYNIKAKNIIQMLLAFLRALDKQQPVVHDNRII